MGNLEFPNQVEVVNAAHCNVTDTGGCSSSTAIPLGDDDSEGSIVVDTATHTVYVAGPSAIAVIDTRHCRASDTSGCGSLTPATVTVGNGAFSIALAPAHHTLYVPNNNNGEGPGTLSMIGTTNCNGDDSSGCAMQPSATTLTGRAPLADQVDPSTGTLYVTNFADASVFTYNTATCNAQTQTGCAHPPPEVIVGSGPDDVLVDDAHNTVYVPSGNDGKLSLIPSTHRAIGEHALARTGTDGDTDPGVGRGVRIARRARQRDLAFARPSLRSELVVGSSAQHRQLRAVR